MATGWGLWDPAANLAMPLDAHLDLRSALNALGGMLFHPDVPITELNLGVFSKRLDKSQVVWSAQDVDNLIAAVVGFLRHVGGGGNEAGAGQLLLLDHNDVKSSAGKVRHRRGMRRDGSRQCMYVLVHAHTGQRAHNHACTRVVCAHAHAATTCGRMPIQALETVLKRNDSVNNLVQSETIPLEGTTLDTKGGWLKAKVL